MLTTNQVLFIARVGYTIRLGYESAKYLLYQGLHNINLD